MFFSETDKVDYQLASALSRSKSADYNTDGYGDAILKQVVSYVTNAGKAAGDSFFGSRCKAEGDGKKLATNVTGRRTRRRHSGGGLRSDPCHSRTRMERQNRKSGEYGNDDRTAQGPGMLCGLHWLRVALT